jgi:hypothetical protein
LQETGHITVAQIAAFLADLGREIHSLEQRLLHLRGGAHATTPRSAPKPSVATSRKRRETHPAPARTGRKRTFTVTDKVLKSRALQGRYLPLLNKFSGRRRATFAKLAKEKGREAAIAEMESALKSLSR